jgi:hypothetical protein
MRIASKLFLLTAMALSAFAMTAGSAVAQETPIEVRDEDDVGNPFCGTTIATGCPVHAAGSSTLFQHVFGAESQVSSCTDEFQGVVLRNGSGHIHTYRNNHATAPAVCTRVPCATAAEREWRITNAGETGPNRGHFNIRFCLRTETGSDTHCPIEVRVASNANNHVTEFFANDAGGDIAFGIRCEVTGDWNIERSIATNEGLIIVHH